MRAIVLAAGRGKRLHPLTENCPKPLIPVNGKPLIVYHLERLSQEGITEIVINVRYLGEQIQSYLGNGQSFGVNIIYSVENAELEVGGGINAALPLLGKDPFLVVNGDIWTDYPFSSIQVTKSLAHLVMVDNPLHHPKGDFSLSEGFLSKTSDQKTLTYSGISLLHPDLFANCTQGSSFALKCLLDKASVQQALTGEHYTGLWTDVGTLERLQWLESTFVQVEKKLIC